MAKAKFKQKQWDNARLIIIKNSNDEQYTISIFNR